MNHFESLKDQACLDELNKIASGMPVGKGVKAGKSIFNPLLHFAQKHPAGMLAGTTATGFGLDIAGGYLGSHSGAKHAFNKSKK